MLVGVLVCRGPEQVKKFKCSVWQKVYLPKLVVQVVSSERGQRMKVVIMLTCLGGPVDENFGWILLFWVPYFGCCWVD